MAIRRLVPMPIHEARCRADGPIVVSTQSNYIVKRCNHSALGVRVPNCTGYLFVLRIGNGVVGVVEITIDEYKVLNNSTLSPKAAMRYLDLMGWRADDVA